MLFAYVGPEVTLPVASTLVAVIGFFLAGGRFLAAKVVGLFRRRGRDDGPAQQPPAPEA